MDASISASLVLRNSAALLPPISALLSNHWMASVKEIRLANLVALIDREASLAAFARKTHNEPIYIRQLKDQVPDSKTGRPRQMGDLVAARIEAAYKMEPGAMDRPLPQDVAPSLKPASEAPIGTLEQLEADWNALPEGWRFHICRKARKLRLWADQIPPFLKDSIKPIQDDSEYHAWEARLEASLAEKERQDVNQRKPGIGRNKEKRDEP